ncbi:MAG: KilA-N domain-containing protein [Melioribacteraceae bacterium]|nr:KilA-N domain-containing protein [Melioribacteraceae bacterium]
MKKILVKGFEIQLFAGSSAEFISLTDIAKSRDPERTDYIIQNWLRNRNTIEFIGLWETLHNPNFNSIEFDGFRNQAGLNSFSLTPSKWIERTNSIGIISKSGRYGGTFAHQDIAFEFASWISAEFKIYLLKEFQRLKTEESDAKSLDWNFQRTLAKVNYKIHTDAIKENLIPTKVSKHQINFIYASEADILNMALFGLTSKDWRDKNPNIEGNLRDFATLEQLIVLSNLESINAVLINNGLTQSERLIQLNGIAINQMKSLINSAQIKKLNK